MSSPSDSSEAIGAPITDANSAAEAFAAFELADEQGTESTDASEDVDGDDLAAADIDEGDEADEQADEPDKPAIAPPVSLNAEEKKAFEQLPPEAQQLIAAVETRRNTQVQEATTKASEAQRSAEARAAAADVQAQAEYAARLEQVGQAFAPQPPNPNAYTDRVEYLLARDQYTEAHAQHVQFMQQVATMKTGAQTQAVAIDNQARAQDLLTIPELADPTARDPFVQESLELVKFLGLDPGAFEQTASSQDFKALKVVRELKVKADKYDQAMSRKMQRVRSGTPRSIRPNTAQPERSGNSADRLTQQFNERPSRDTAAALMAQYLA
jgi:hypothetical protein